MSSPEEIASILNLESCEDEEISTAIIGVITAAIHDENSPQSLKDIHHILTTSGLSSLLDPLHIVPLLVPCQIPAARDILSLVGECSSAKEVVMAVQEMMEQIENSFHAIDNEGSDVGEEEEEEVKAGVEHTTLVSQLVILMDLYASAIPRIRLRQKSAIETLQPLLADIETIFPTAGAYASVYEGRAMIESASALIERVLPWARDDSSKGTDSCHDALNSLLDCAVTSSGKCIRSAIAQRTFEKIYPQLVVRSLTSLGWEEGERVIQRALRANATLRNGPEVLMSKPSTSTLIFMAYSDETTIPPEKLLSELLPIIIASIQAHSALDESFAVLMSTLHRLRVELSPEIVGSLCAVLPTVASVHLDPDTRHQAFRILSSVLKASAPQLRFHILKDLTSSTDFPQMRVAAIGLVKEAVVEALISSSLSPFASPMFLRDFGPVFLRTDPPDLFIMDVDLDKFQNSQEPQRLVECLALYYVLLQRDTKNLTGIRDKDVLSGIEQSLLVPLRRHVEKWLNNRYVFIPDKDVVIQLASLSLGLERIEEAKTKLHNSWI